MTEKHNRKKRSVIVCLAAVLLIGCLAAFGIVWHLNIFSIEFNIPDSETQEIAFGENYEPPTVEALLKGTILFKKGIPLEVTKSGEVDTNKTGTYTESYTASVRWICEGEVTRKIHVVDVMPPVITLAGDAEMHIDQHTAFEEPGFTATDDYDGDLTERVRADGEVNADVCGAYTIKYTVADAAGNETSAVRTIYVDDKEAPEIAMAGDTEMVLTVGNTFSDPGCTASDNVDGEVTVSAEGQPDMSTPGDYMIHYRAVDAAGNEAECTRTVYVKAAPPADIKDPGDKVVYLTFDDGPGKYTDDLLAVLDKYNVKATFFVTNQFPDYKYMIAREAEAGHTVAIHTYSHDFSDVYASEENYFADVNRISDVCEDQTGVRPTLLRFPGGTSNEVSKRYCQGIMTAITASCDTLGYRYCDWNVDSNDAGGASTASEVADNVIAGIKSHNVSYVLQHDIKGFSVDAVEEIIQWGLANGYTFLPLTTSSPMCHHSVHN